MTDRMFDSSYNYAYHLDNFTFPSDIFALQSQIRLKGYDPAPI
jgi:hypothetical protein